MPRAVRHINETRILDTLFRKGQMSRADLARELGLMRSTAGNLVAGLVRDGLVLEPEADTAGRGGRAGRPGSIVSLNGRHSLFLGASIGVGQMTVIAIDLLTDVVGRAARSFDPRTSEPAAIVEALATLIEGLLDTFPDADKVRGLNVAVAGLIDRDFSVMRAPILRWVNVPLIAMLKERLPDLSPILAENDANAFAMAELYRSQGPLPRNNLYVLLDAGVGGGLVADGQLLRGHDGYAGEIGHIPVGENGFGGASALPGSLESFIGRDAVLARERFHGGHSATIEDFGAALDTGSYAARATLADWAHYLGRGLAILIPVFNPQRIILGGPVARLFNKAGDEVARAMKACLLPSQPLPYVGLSQLGPDAAAIGAASMLHRNLLSLDEELVFNGVRPEGGRKADETLRHLSLPQG